MCPEVYMKPASAYEVRASSWDADTTAPVYSDVVTQRTASHGSANMTQTGPLSLTQTGPLLGAPGGSGGCQCKGGETVRRRRGQCLCTHGARC